MLPPQALLLDFGGVIAEAAPNSVDPAIYDRVHRVIRGALPIERIAADMAAADVARDQWRSDPENPELTHAQLWGTFVAKGWPVPARAAVVEHCTELAYAWADRRFQLVEGITELLEYTLSRGLPVAVVSNTRCGRAYRDFLERSGLTSAFAVQVYSDEVGVFKPHPEMILSATRALDIPPRHCWFVGDSITRDIECGRRAGVGAVIHRPSGPQGDSQADADAVVEDGHELLKLLKTER